MIDFQLEYELGDGILKLSIEWHYVSAKKQQTIFNSEPLPAAHVYTLVEDMQKTGRVKQVILTDAQDSTWTMKELKKYLTEMETEPQDVSVYFDGGFHREEQRAGLGAVIYFQQNAKSYRLRVNQQADYLVSNNEAEYAALYFALELFDELGVHHQEVAIFGDSQVVIKELNGEWAVTDNVLSKWADRIEHKLGQLGITPTYTHIDRAKNDEADQLANQALAGTAIHAQKEIRKK
ncbi:MAG: reverse transcriptase-like protein [Solibacillus sp.]